MESNKKAKRVILMFIILLLLVMASLIFMIKSFENTTTVATENNVSTEKTTNEEKTQNVVSTESQSKQVAFSDDIEVVPTLLDEISLDTAWCATFQLVWNDMQNEVVGKDIEFEEENTMVDNLNKQTFTEEDISEEYYYKVYGLKTLDLKEEIENAIYQKFNQTSDVLNLLDWDDTPQDDSEYENSDMLTYIFYAMLYREFNFENKFTELDNSEFFGTDETYEDVLYFGIDSSTNSEVYSQVDVLYYNSNTDFAVVLNSKEGDKVVLCRNDEETNTNYQDIWNEINEKEEEYDGNKEFTENDSLKVPNIEFNIAKEFDVLENQTFTTEDVDYPIAQITSALQTIQFSLDESGGKIKSEAVIEMTESVLDFDEEPEPVEYRYFNLNNTFSMFLLEDGKDLPYFAATIDNIELFQNQD